MNTLLPTGNKVSGQGMNAFYAQRHQSTVRPHKRRGRQGTWMRASIGVEGRETSVRGQGRAASLHGVGQSARTGGSRRSRDDTRVIHSIVAEEDAGEFATEVMELRRGAVAAEASFTRRLAPVPKDSTRRRRERRQDPETAMWAAFERSLQTCRDSSDAAASASGWRTNPPPPPNDSPHRFYRKTMETDASAVKHRFAKSRC